MTKELESALYACVRYLLQVRAHAMEDAGQRDARNEALGYLETLHEAYLNPPAEDAPPRDETVYADPFADEDAGDCPGCEVCRCRWCGCPLQSGKTETERLAADECLTYRRLQGSEI